MAPSFAGTLAEAPPELSREADGLYLSARLPLETPAGLEEVLLRGVPVHFVWQADLLRARWYWKDQRLVTVQRVVRVAYQPLTRRWRVSVSSGSPMETGLAGALHQNLDAFEQAMAAVVSVSRWKLADTDMLPDGADLRVDLQLRLDGGLLSRPFQQGGPGQMDWGEMYRVTLQVPS